MTAGSSGTDKVVVGLVAPPGLPAEIAQDIATKLPGALVESVGDHVSWETRFVSERRAHDVDDDDELIDVAREKREQEGWDLAVSLTDLTLPAGRRPVVAQASRSDGVVLVSLPALGARRARSRGRDATVRMIGSLVGDDAEPLRLLAAPVRGHLRLLAGMVRDNRPWLVVLALSRALAVALSTAAFALITNTTWQLGVALGPVRLSAMTLGALAVMVIWLIVVHRLWRRPSEGVPPLQAALFNAVTVVTLAIGAASLAAVLFLLSLLAAAVILDGGVLEQTIGRPADAGDYVALAWYVSSLAMIGGTLGSGLEKEIDVRSAAYGYHPERHEDPD